MKENQKSWFRRHWILSIFLGLIVLGIIGSLFGGDSDSDLTGDVINEQSREQDNVIQDSVEACNPNWQCGEWSECGSSGTQIRTCTDLNNCNILTDKPEESQSCIYAYEEEQIEISMDKLYSTFSDYSELSEIQKEEIYETEYKSKIIKTSIIADKINEASLHFLTGDYVVLEMSGLTSCFAKAFFLGSEKDKLLEANIGDTIVFTGKLVNYDFGLTSCLEFTDSKVLEIK